VSPGRIIQKALAATVKPVASFVAHHKGAGGRESIRSESSIGQKATTDVDSGTVTTTIEGRAPQNEEGALETANMLVRKLRTFGQDWTDAHEIEEQDNAADCRARSASHPETYLDIQVVRLPNAVVGWDLLGRTGTTSTSPTVANAADGILEAVKAKVKKYGPGPHDMALAIDARLTTAFSTQLVIDDFRNRLTSDPLVANFRSVWLVGPTEEMVFELSSPGSSPTGT
jgi:hypothetical protein